MLIEPGQLKQRTLIKMKKMMLVLIASVCCTAFAMNASAIDHIQQLLAAPAGFYISGASLRTDPVWDPLRQDSRFQALLQQIGSPATGNKP